VQIIHDLWRTCHRLCLSTEKRSEYPLRRMPLFARLAHVLFQLLVNGRDIRPDDQIRFRLHARRRRAVILLPDVFLHRPEILTDSFAIALMDFPSCSYKRLVYSTWAMFSTSVCASFFG
jgi:hypothetical protein